MRLLSILALLSVSLVCSSGSWSQTSAEQPDISKSGSNFLEACSTVDTAENKGSVQIHNDAACLSWVQGFADGFTVHDELLSVPRRDRMACMPRGVTTIQIVRAIKKYLANNPDKARRPTRYIASLAMANAFSCKAGK